jgi:hypothetical protein
VGTKQPRNVYRVTDAHPEGEYIGVFFDPKDAGRAVTAFNVCWRLMRGDDEAVESSR